MKDTLGRYVYVNKTLAEKWAPFQGAWMGKTDAELWPAGRAAYYSTSDSEVIAGGTQSHMLILTRLRANGGIF